MGIFIDIDGLITNAAATEALPIFLERVVPEAYMAIIISVTLVLFFGEIIPQAICSRYGLAIGYYLSIPVWILIGIEFILAYPISLVLDCVIGKHHSDYMRRADLKALVKIHGEKRDEEDGDGPLTVEEVNIIRSALNMQEITVFEVITELKNVFAISIYEKIDRNLLEKIKQRGHSRIPVFRKTIDHIVGVLLVKSIININVDDNLTIDQLDIVRIPYVNSNTPLYFLLNQFIKSFINDFDEGCALIHT